MKILSLHTSNFRLHADSTVTFPGEGVVGIIGSNEAGKSTLLEAFMWALFGATATRGSKGSLRWNRAPARRTASVTLRFVVGGKTYRIERGESTAAIVDEASGETIAEKTSGVDEYVPRLLGMTHDEFRASFLCRQRDLNRLASMGGTERQAFIRSVLGVGKIDAALKSCRKRKGELAAGRAGLEAGLGERAPLVEAVEAAEGELRAAAQYLADQKEVVGEATSLLDIASRMLLDSQQAKTEHDRLAVVKRDVEFELTGHITAVDRLKKEMRQAFDAAQRVKEAEQDLSALPELRAERDTLRDARAAQGQRDSLVTLERELLADAARLDEEALSLRSDPQVTLSDLQGALAASEERVSEIRAKLAKMRAAREGKRSGLQAVARMAAQEAGKLTQQAERLREIGAESPCPTCTRPLGDAIQDVLDTLHGEIARQQLIVEDRTDAAAPLAEPEDDEVEAEIALNDAAEDAEVGRSRVRAEEQNAAGLQRVYAERKKAGARLEAAQKRLTELPTVAFDAARLMAVESEVQRLEGLDASLAQSRGAAARIPEISASIEEHGSKAADVHNSLKRANASITDLAFNAENHADRTKTHEVAQLGVQDARIALARAEEAHNGAASTLRRAKAGMYGYDLRAESLRELVEEHRLHERGDARLSDFRVAVAGTIRPELEELVSGFVHLLTDGRHESVTLSEDFTPVLHESGVPTEVVSGGTEDITALAMRLAISQMIAERAGHPLSLLILDEPFGSLDAVRRANVLTLIRRLRSVFDQVVVISHVEETRDAVDHVVELEFSEADGMTRVVSAPMAVEQVA